MKKFLLSCLAFSAVLFTACEKESGSDDNGTQQEDGYTLTITPETAAIGSDITLSVSGDGAEDISWLSCFNRVDDGSGSCLMTSFVDGKMTMTLSADLFTAGEYKFYVTDPSDADVKSNYASVTVTE